VLVILRYNLWLFYRLPEQIKSSGDKLKIEVLSIICDKAISIVFRHFIHRTLNRRCFPFSIPVEGIESCGLTWLPPLVEADTDRDDFSFCRFEMGCFNIKGGDPIVAWVLSSKLHLNATGVRY